VNFERGGEEEGGVVGFGSRLVKGVFVGGEGERGCVLWGMVGKEGGLFRRFEGLIRAGDREGGGEWAWLGTWKANT